MDEIFSTFICVSQLSPVKNVFCVSWVWFCTEVMHEEHWRALSMSHDTSLAGLYLQPEANVESRCLAHDSSRVSEGVSCDLDQVLKTIEQHAEGQNMIEYACRYMNMNQGQECATTCWSDSEAATKDESACCLLGMSCCTALTSSMVWTSLRLAVFWSFRSSDQSWQSWNLCNVCSKNKARKPVRATSRVWNHVIGVRESAWFNSVNRFNRYTAWLAGLFSRSIWQGTRYSVIFWFKDSMASVKNDTTPWYDKMAQSSSATWMNFGPWWWVRFEAVDISWHFYYLHQVEVD